MAINQPRKFYPGMWLYPRNHNRCCIYRVPNCIRDVNPEAYTPQLVLIGPLHYSLKSQALKSLLDLGDITYTTKSMGYLNMEEHKKMYLAEFSQRFGGNIIDGFKRMIIEDEEKIRASYSESTAWIESQDFVEMVLHDSVFIMEYILRATTGVPERIGDPLMYEECLRIIVKHDLMLLENQLPYFILTKLFDPIIPRISRNQSTFREVIINYFDFKGKIGNNSEFIHLTDLFRCVHIETHSTRKRDEGGGNRVHHMYNADKLDSGGVKFKAEGGSKFSLNVTFENGCLTIPCLIVDDDLETRLRNIMALEQCHYPYDTHVCNYIFFLDHLIDTKKDVDVLVEKGIIENWIGEPALVAQMVNKLGLGFIDAGSYHSDIAVEVKSYYSNPIKRSQAILKRVYFGDLWTGSATIAAIFLLVMALIQTWASVVQVKQNITVASIIQLKQDASYR